MYNGLESSRPDSSPGQRETVLVIDDGELTAHQLKAALRADHRRVLVCGTAREALAVLPDIVPDCIIASLDLADLRGPAILDVLRDRARDVKVICTAAEPSIELAVHAVRLGAVDVLVRPVKPALVVAAVDRVMAETRTAQQLEAAREEIKDRYGFSHLLTQSPRMLRVFDQIRAVAGTDATVLIRGETGTGKELVSRAIHERSRRKDEPFIGVNCGAFTESLLESELFGHERGSFTGAVGKHEGVFEMADGGTLFLDELGETTLNVQVNLLRVLEEMCFRRVGGHEMVHVDVRIIAATNATLEDSVKAKQFREDLYYRLNVFPIHLPPLRSRPEDIPLLIRHFLDDAAREYELDAPKVMSDAMEAILRYRWPGNVRQLRAMCERWVIVSGGRGVTLDLLPGDMRLESKRSTPDEMVVDLGVPMSTAVERAAAQMERCYLHRLLQRHAGHLRLTAEAAGITRRTLYNKLKAYGLEADDYRKPSTPAED
jgi:DNA-binding NtrC family response regulator